MSSFEVRPAIAEDLPRITEIYNHYVANTAVTFDVEPLTPAQREAWFHEHAPSGRHRVFVVVNSRGSCQGYASSSRWQAKGAYATTVETSVYCDPAAHGQGYGTALYTALFDALAGEDVNVAVAGICLPNVASVALHRRFGFQSIGVFRGVGRKFGRFWDVEWFERPIAFLRPGAG